MNYLPVGWQCLPASLPSVVVIKQILAQRIFPNCLDDGSDSQSIFRLFFDKDWTISGWPPSNQEITPMGLHSLEVCTDPFPEAIRDGSRHLQVSYFISRWTSPSSVWSICFSRQPKAELYNMFSTPLLNRFFSRTYLCSLFCDHNPQTNEQVTCSWQCPLASHGSPLWSLPAMYNHIFQSLCRIIDVHGICAAQTFFLFWKHGLSSIMCPTVSKTQTPKHQSPKHQYRLLYFSDGPSEKYRKPS